MSAARVAARRGLALHARRGRRHQRLAPRAHAPSPARQPRPTQAHASCTLGRPPGLCGAGAQRLPFERRARAQRAVGAGRITNPRCPSPLPPPSLYPPAGKKVKLSFKLPYRTNFGQDVAIVGSTEELGSWDPRRGLGMQWSEGDIWVCDFEVPIRCAHGAAHFEWFTT